MPVEELGLADLDALVQLRMDYLREDSGPLDQALAQRLRADLPGYYRAHLGRDLLAFGARQGQEIVSCAFLLVTEKPMSRAFPNGKTGTVLNVYTRPAFRRRGVAGQVMQALLARADALELSLVELKATPAGARLYQSLGFTDDEGKYRPMKRRPSSL